MKQWFAYLFLTFKVPQPIIASQSQIIISFVIDYAFLTVLYGYSMDRSFWILRVITTLGLKLGLDIPWCNGNKSKLMTTFADAEKKFLIFEKKILKFEHGITKIPEMDPYWEHWSLA